MYTSYLDTFNSKPVRAFDPLTPLPSNAADFAWRLSFDWDPQWYQTLKQRAENVGRSFSHKADFTFLWTLFTQDPNTPSIDSLIIGNLGEVFGDNIASTLDTFVRGAPALPKLKALFIPDVTYEDSEVSWIQLPDPKPILDAFPHLETMGFRGGFNDEVGHVSHKSLKKLVIQSGGVPSRAVRAIASWNLPNLEHLEILLGCDDYGGDTQAHDLAPFLTGKLHPKLHTLGLCNSEVQGDILRAIVGAPIFEKITHLDLSKGTLCDADVQPLFSCPPLHTLQTLDLRNNFLSPDMDKALQTLPFQVLTGTNKDLPGEGEEDFWLYCSVAE